MRITISMLGLALMLQWSALFAADGTCASNTDCQGKEFCKFATGSCGEDMKKGVCTTKPDICTEQYAPVVGCDNKEYSNDCKAYAAGTSVRSVIKDKKSK